MPSLARLVAALLAPAAALAFVFVGCSSSSDDEGAPSAPVPTADGGVPLLGSDCDPLVPAQCLLPFPSDVWLDDDPSTPTGKRVRFGKTSLPRTGRVSPISPAVFADLDGFSPGQTILAHLPLAAATGLVDPAHIPDSLEASSPTVLIEASTGARVPHWAELDMSTRDDGREGRPDQRALMIRPAVRLKNATRYIVAIRRVVDDDGAPVAPSPAFAALRDGSASSDYSVYARRGHYEEIFGRLEGAGVPRGDLQLAWDFTTASRESATQKLLHMRDDALATVGEDGPTFTVKKVEEAPSQHILRRITLAMTVPSYLDRNDYDPKQPGPRLVLDEHGVPRQNGTLEWEVLVHVPNGVVNGPKHGILQNGHGLLGSAHEGQNGYLAEMADGWHWIAMSTDLMGFAGDDLDLATDALSSRPELLRSFVDLQQQGHLNQLLAMRMMIGRIAKTGIRDDQGNLLLDPAWIDRDTRAYRGDSQGGIMGATYMALSTDVTRGLLGEPGMPYSLLLNRSQDWPEFGLVLGSTYAGGLDTQVMLGLVQMVWDQSEPDGWAPFISDGTLPNTPKHQVLLHAAIGDHQVTTLGAHVLARAIDAVNLASDDPARPLVRDVWGVPSAAAPVSGRNVLVEYDFGLPEPLDNVPATKGCDPHDRVRELLPSYEQTDAFLRTGTVGWSCDGICNCDGSGSEEGCGPVCTH